MCIKSVPRIALSLLVVHAAHALPAGEDDDASYPGCLDVHPADLLQPTTTTTTTSSTTETTATAMPTETCVSTVPDWCAALNGHLTCTFDRYWWCEFPDPVRGSPSFALITNACIC